eukprot:2028560-Pyramimonas_sp.AAC.1
MQRPCPSFNFERSLPCVQCRESRNRLLRVAKSGNIRNPSFRVSNTDSTKHPLARVAHTGGI